MRAAGRRCSFDFPDQSLTPDFYFPDHRVAVFVHGCFWHGHTCRKGTQSPKTNTKYWTTKVARNQIRDRRVARILRNLGISVYAELTVSLRAHRPIDSLKPTPPMCIDLLEVVKADARGKAGMKENDAVLLI
jgi:DNA mismatch endonuclease Vsr